MRLCVEEMLSRKHPLQSLIGSVNTISLAGNIGRACSPDVPTKPMTVIFFDRNHNGEFDHVGIVEYCDGTYVHTIERNNNGDICKCNTYLVGYSGIMGYGVRVYR